MLLKLLSPIVSRPLVLRYLISIKYSLIRANLGWINKDLEQVTIGMCKFKLISGAAILRGISVTSKKFRSL